MNATSTSAQAQLEAELVQSLNQAIPPTVGACLLGSYLAAMCVFYGVTLLQTYQYFNRYYKRDSIYLCVLIALKSFGYLTGYFEHDYSSSIVVTATVGFLVQSLYAHRAYVLGGRKLLIPIIILVFGMIGLGLGLTYAGFLLNNNNLFVILTKTSWSTGSLACSFFADVVLSTSITWYLLQARTGVLKKSDTLIRRLVIYTLNTGIITTACTIVTLILSEARQNTFDNYIVYSLLSKCYVNSVLAFLNSRDDLRKNDVSSFHLSSTPTTLQLRMMSNPKSAAKIPPRRRGSVSTIYFNKAEISTIATSQTLDPVMATDDVPEALDHSKPSL
ncbi:hypothetical protein Clacol_001215 [Clathrus columnatus]|uniref:DUF6534 domain-containing protein n=1 Tax=Clathrus columnatus TaxID=1419009 RepID=A0AAV5A0R6_9AGAM|nr:hypothetical protein Clacol_001215 [Clathrus columnatus]